MRLPVNGRGELSRWRWPGMVELRWISFETTPPMVSMPSESGVTSSSSCVLDLAREDAGLHGGAQRDDFIGIQFGMRLARGTAFRPRLRTRGMRVDPPTSTTSSICFHASLRHP